MKKQIRCGWADKGDPLYEEYHDKEWGVPVYDDQKLFEFLILESAQAGLSWITILRKRENYRAAFDGFDYKKIAKYDEKKVLELLGNAGIIRNRLKIEAAINNAKKFIEVQKEFSSFSNYMWQFVNHKQVKNCFKTLQDLPAQSEISHKFYKDLKKRGFKFLGPVICYSHMQAVGMVNDHIQNCFRHNEINAQK